MSSDDEEGRVIPFPALGGLRPPIGGTTTTAPPAPPPAPPAAPEPESDLLTAFPALAGAQLAPPLALTLPALAPDDEDQAADDDQAETVHQDGGMTAREAATLGVMVASAITVACLRGTVALASWYRARAEHHRTVHAEAAKAAAKAAGTGGGRVPSGPEFGRAKRSGGRAGIGSGGRSGGGSGGGRAPATFRSGSGSLGAGGTTRPAGGNSRPPAASGGGKDGTGPGSKRRNGSGSPTSPSGSGATPPARRKRKNGGDSGGSGGTGGGSSSGGSGTSTSPKGKSKGPKGPKSGKGKGTGTSPASTSPKGKGGKGSKSKGGKGKGGGSKSPATRTPATSPATRGARARALARRATVRAARGGGRLVRRGGRYLRRVTPPAARRTGRYLNRNGRRVARHTRRWTRARWERIAARAEVRWQRRQAAAAAAAAAGTTGPAAGPIAPGSGPATPPPGPTSTGPGTGTKTPPSGPGATPWGPGPGGGPWAGYGPLAPPPAMTDPYAVTVERPDWADVELVDVAELVVAEGDTPPPDAPPGQAWEPLRGVDGGWVLVDVAELVEPEPITIPIPAARTAAAATNKETAPVSDLPATPSAIAEGVAAMAGPAYDSGASELTIYDLTDADEDAAEEIVARADTAHQDAKAAAALVNHMEDLKATIIAWKIPGALYRYACRLQEKAAALAVDSRALAQELPAASEAIKTAGANAAARHKPLADTVRDLGHAAPAEADYHG